MTIPARKTKSNDSDELTEEANHTPIPMSNSSGAKQWLQTKDWERVELRYWGKHPIPHVSDVNRKLLNTETLTLTRIKLLNLLKNTSRLARSSIFVINSNNLANLDVIKSDVDGIFKRCLEANCKIFDDTNDKCVKVVPSNINNKLKEGQVFIHINRRENIHGHIWNIVYFKDKNKATINQNKC